MSDECVELCRKNGSFLPTTIEFCSIVDLMALKGTKKSVFVLIVCGFPEKAGYMACGAGGHR